MLWKLVSEIGDSSVRADDIELSRTAIEGLTFVVLKPGAFYGLAITPICEVLDEIIHPFPNFNGAAVEVWEWISNFIPHLTVHVITHPCWDSI